MKQISEELLNSLEILLDEHWVEGFNEGLNVALIKVRSYFSRHCKSTWEGQTSSFSPKQPEVHLITTLSSNLDPVTEIEKMLEEEK